MEGFAVERGTLTETTLVAVPRHVAIIMDGNGRWARARGLPRVAGHRAGAENLRVTVRAAIEFGIGILTIYAFSTENWTRPRREVQVLMGIFERALASELEELHRNRVRIRHIGRTQGLSSSLVERIRKAQEVTQHNDRLLLNIAFNYGGRADMIDAVRGIVRDGIPADQVDEATISRYLSTGGIADPDLVIRTGGDMRLSNFLVWESSYAEFYSTPTFWPDFDRQELRKALIAYQQRERKFGRLPEEPD